MFFFMFCSNFFELNKYFNVSWYLQGLSYGNSNSNQTEASKNKCKTAWKILQIKLIIIPGQKFPLISSTNTSILNQFSQKSKASD